MTNEEQAFARAFAAEYMLTADAQLDIAEWQKRHPGMSYQGAANDVAYHVEHVMRNEIADKNFRVHQRRMQVVDHLVVLAILFMAYFIPRIF